MPEPTGREKSTKRSEQIFEVLSNLSSNLDEILSIAWTINANLFGEKPMDESKKPEDVKACGVLQEIIRKIGVLQDKAHRIKDLIEFFDREI